MSTDRVQEYLLLDAPTTEALSGVVNDFLKRGYRPHGSPIMGVDPAFDNSVIFAQAVVKFAPNHNTKGFHHGRGTVKIVHE